MVPELLLLRMAIREGVQLMRILIAKIVFTTAFILSCPIFPAPAAETVRLAIIGEGDVSLIPDLLTAEFTTNKTLALLERTEIEKIAREQKLAASGASKDVVTLGQLLGADGLLTVDVVNSVLHARLIAVKPGVVLDVIQAPWPLSDPGQWVKGVAAHLQPLLPKLGVLQKDALPISILNLRAAAHSTESTRIEQELTLLLTDRLTRERDLFVLERRRMEALTSEKELSQKVNTPFWNGAYLLDGVIDREGFNVEQITVNARISPPNGGTPTEIAVAGPRKDLPAIVEQLTKRILEALKKRASAPAWKPSDEAAHYADEAQWAYKWRMLIEAQIASESAWVLGRKDMDLASLRVRAYSDETFNLIGIDDGQDEIKIWNTPPVLAIPISPRLLPITIRGLEVFLEATYTLKGETNSLPLAWYEMGTQLADRASQVLMHYYFAVERRWGHEDELAQLRERTRDVVASILTAPSIQEKYWNQQALDFEGSWESRPNRRTIFELKARYCGLWQDHPEQTVAIYRELITGDYFAALRPFCLARELNLPRVIGWTWADRQKCADLWGQLMTELSASTNASVKCDGLFFAVDVTENLRELETSLNTLCQTLVENKAALLRDATLSPRYIEQIDRLKRARPYGETESSTGKYKADIQALEDQFKVRKAELKARQAELKVKEARAAQIEEKKQYLREQKPYNSADFSHHFALLNNYSASEARELLPFVHLYLTNLTAQQPKGFKEINQVRMATEQATRLEQAFTSMASPATNISTIQPAPPVFRVVTPKPRPTPQLAAEERATIIPVDHFIPFSPSPRDSSKLVDHVLFREKQLWVVMSGADYSENQAYLGKKTVLIAVDGDKETCELINLPKGSSAGIEIVGGLVYVCVGETLMKYHLAKKTWEPLPVVVEEGSALCWLNGHLYIQTPQTLAQLAEDGRSIRLLGSTRRNPPVNVLDQLEHLSSLLLAGPQNSLRVLTGTGIYVAAATNWVRSIQLPYGARSAKLDSGAFLNSDGQVWFLPKNEDRLELLVDSPEAPNQRRQRPSIAGIVTNPVAPVWPQLKERSLLDRPFVAWQNHLCFFRQDGSPTPRQNANFATDGRFVWDVTEVQGRHASFICFDRESPTALNVGLKFDFTKGEFPRLESGAAWLVEGESGLFLLGQSLQGCWIIPQSVLTTALTKEKQRTRLIEKKEHDKKESVERRLIEKFDQNKNGILELSERELAVADPGYLNSQLGTIDRNTNGVLDALDDFSIFDANQNQTLEPAEAQAIEVFQKILATQMLDRFDENNDHCLDPSELLALYREEQQTMAKQSMSIGPSYFRGGYTFEATDVNRDQRVVVDDLTIIFHRCTINALLQVHHIPIQPPNGPWQKGDTQRLYQGAVEFILRKGQAPAQKASVTSPTPALKSQP
ncbi:MAG: Calcium-binding EF-hand-containing protein [Verrucomicrobiales bacterium]|nr:Calcium-binding EF-hand-containing protein [Verrucomicrobiales bacterium]